VKIQRSASGLELAIEECDPAALPGTGGLIADALMKLNEGLAEAQLYELDEYGAAEVYYVLARLMRVGLLEGRADDEHRTVVRLVPRRPDFEFPRPSALPTRCVLDRFAYLHRDPAGATLKLPGTDSDLIFEDVGCGDLLVRLMASPVTPAALTDSMQHALLRLLAALGFIEDADALEAAARQSWEFHDRLFHYSARSYPDRIVRGATYRFLDAFPPPPALRPSYSGTVIPLPGPDPEQCARSRPLFEVMEARRSRRAIGTDPVTPAELSAVLYRVARITGMARGTKIPQDLLRRPFPSGGSIHELEFYAAIGCCAGIDAGFYHYVGHQHSLIRLAPGAVPAARMLKDCALAWEQPERPPQVLIVIAARLPRVAWKYQGIAYKLSLLDAGVALQSLYLVTTDLGLSGAAAGSGNPELFALATGADPWEETSIAEFGFGRPPVGG
jgi:SagB-type dehydrogenase family enzyme